MKVRVVHAGQVAKLLELVFATARQFVALQRPDSIELGLRSSDAHTGIEQYSQTEKLP